MIFGAKIQIVSLLVCFLISLSVTRHVSLHNSHVITHHNLNVLIQRLVNQGLIQHFIQKAQMEIKRGQKDVLRHSRKIQSNSGSSDGQYAEITLHELSSILLLAMFGQAVSVVVFGIELLVARMNERKL